MKYEITPTITRSRWGFLALLLALAASCDLFNSGSGRNDTPESAADWSEPVLFYRDTNSDSSKTGQFQAVVHEDMIHAVTWRNRSLDDLLLDFSQILFLEKEVGTRSEAEIRELTPGAVPSEQPLILRDHTGTFHLLWGDRRLDPGFDRWESQFSQLGIFSTNVIYTRSDGSSFEPPVSIYEGNLSTLGRGDIGFPLRLIEAEDHRLHAVFKADSAFIVGDGTTPMEGDSVEDFISRATYMNRSTTGQWSRPRFLGVDPRHPAIGTAHNPDIAAPSANRLVVVWIGSAGDLNDVLAVTSGDGGLTWSEPRLIVSSNQRPAIRLRLIQAPDDRLHLIVGKSSTIFLPTEMWHTYSENGGETWSPPQRFLAVMNSANVIFPFDVLVDEAGRVHWAGLEVDIGDNLNNKIHYTTWNPGTEAWEEPSLFDMASAPNLIDLALDESTQKLYLFWMERFERTVFYSVK